MNVITFLNKEIKDKRMNDDTLLTIYFKRKNYLCSIQDCCELFGSLLLKECKKRRGFDNQEMENSYVMKVV